MCRSSSYMHIKFVENCTNFQAIFVKTIYSTKITIPFVFWNIYILLLYTCICIVIAWFLTILSNIFRSWPSFIVSHYLWQRLVKIYNVSLKFETYSFMYMKHTHKDLMISSFKILKSLPPKLPRLLSNHIECFQGK